MLLICINNIYTMIAYSYSTKTSKLLLLLFEKKYILVLDFFFTL